MTAGMHNPEWAYEGGNRPRANEDWTQREEEQLMELFPPAMRRRMTAAEKNQRWEDLSSVLDRSRSAVVQKWDQLDARSGGRTIRRT